MRKTVGMILAGCCLTACGEPAFENAGSANSLIEDREACAAEIESSPATSVYRQNPDAHPEYPVMVFNELNSCIEKKGWKQVRSEQEQDRTREEIANEAAKIAPRSVATRTTESIIQAIEKETRTFSK